MLIEIVYRDGATRKEIQFVKFVSRYELWSLIIHFFHFFFFFLVLHPAWQIFHCVLVSYNQIWFIDANQFFLLLEKGRKSHLSVFTYIFFVAVVVMLIGCASLLDFDIETITSSFLPFPFCLFSNCNCFHVCLLHNFAQYWSLSGLVYYFLYQCAFDSPKAKLLLICLFFLFLSYCMKKGLKYFLSCIQWTEPHSYPIAELSIYIEKSSGEKAGCVWWARIYIIICFCSNMNPDIQHCQRSLK